MHLRELHILQDRFPTRQAYPFNLRVLQETKRIALDAPVTFLVGENGSGKSTLLRALAQHCHIHIWENSERSRAHHNPYAERLWECVESCWDSGPKTGSFFAAEMFRGFAELLDAWATSDPDVFTYFGGASLTEKSHGQCNMAFFENRFRVEGLYLLDEPESALSPRRQMELLRILASASQHHRAQFIVATHSPLLLSLPGSRALSFDHCPVQAVPYQETDLYRLYQDFFARAGAA